MIKILVCILAGLGAGLGTGFAGMSAAAVISPMLITFLNMDPYMAVCRTVATARRFLGAITGRTINFTPSSRVMKTEKLPMVVLGTMLAT